MSNGCPVAPLNVLQTGAQLGLISVGNVDASFVRSFVAFNAVQLEDDESLQQDNPSTAAMRVKRSMECLLSSRTSAEKHLRHKLRSTGPATAVA